MRIHILGICGTFMGGLAVLARQMGYEVTGSDENVYPPMSTQLEQQGIKLLQGFSASNLRYTPDLVIVGNVIKRGNPELEYVLNNDLTYVSGPEWLAKYVLAKRHVLAVAGTHGKTTTTSILAWILEKAGLNSGFLIGGVPDNFGVSARLGSDPFFVIEADEYDSAFFDKRPKFMHYRPQTLILNNLEFDHADIFADLQAIKLQFHYLLRTVSGNGLVIYAKQDKNLQAVLKHGCWTPLETFAAADADWQVRGCDAMASNFTIYHGQQLIGEVNWSLLGEHNMLNALAAVAAAYHVGVSRDAVIAALNSFNNVKRRLEFKGETNGIKVYDDFAHHPTAIQTTLAALRAKVAKERIFAVMEFGTNTMRSGLHNRMLPKALAIADQVLMLEPQAVDWKITDLTRSKKINSYATISDILESLCTQLQSGDNVIFMSNKSFAGIQEKLLEKLK